MNKATKKLYRKVNTRARGVYHHFGGDFRTSRKARQETMEVVKGSMHGSKNRGLDYTPLFRFLLSKVGEDWDAVFQEAKSRLDRTEPIFWMVALHASDKEDYIRVGESTYFSGLYVDADGKLQRSNPGSTAEAMQPMCTCCTHTFNGVVFGED